jgi:hypothetical protein
MPEEKPDMDLVDVIKDLKVQDPFVPFDILLTSGDRYLIERGENLVEMRSQFFYATLGGERFSFIRKNQIAAVHGSDRHLVRRRTRRPG